MENLELIKQLREETGISVGECKKALDESGNDFEKAKEILNKKGLEIVEKKSEREVKAGSVFSYIHQNKKVGVMLDMRCETDFVASNEEFEVVAREVCLHIAAMNSEDVESLLKEEWIKDDSKTIQDLVSGLVAKFGENILIEKFIRYEIQ